MILLTNTYSYDFNGFVKCHKDIKLLNIHPYLKECFTGYLVKHIKSKLSKTEFTVEFSNDNMRFIS